MNAIQSKASGAGAEHPWRGVLVICATGMAIGLAYNWLGLHGGTWGIPWIGEDRMAQLVASEPVRADSGSGSDGASADPWVTNITDPLAVPADPAGGEGLPEIPARGRPLQIELGALLRYVEAGAAVVIDAREPAEYREGHIPGAINVPYEEAAGDPARLEALDTAGRPIVTYCGGGLCEESLNLAYDLVYAGHPRVAVFMGGFPEWAETGHAVRVGAEP